MASETTCVVTTDQAYAEVDGHRLLLDVTVPREIDKPSDTGPSRFLTARPRKLSFVF